MAKIIVRPWEVGCCLFGCIFFGVERILLGKKKGVVGFGGVACRFCEFLEKKTGFVWFHGGENGR